MALVIRRERIISLYEALGFKTANNWDDERLIKKIESLEELTEGVKIKDAKIRKLLDKILKAGKIKIKTDKPEGATETNMDKKKKKKKKSSKKAAENTEKKTSKKKSSKKEKVEKKSSEKKSSKKSEKKTATKKVGVIASILEIVQKHGPISKAGILSRMEKRFPDRPAEGMKSTIGIQVPSRLNSDKNARIKKNDKNKYFIKAKK